MGRTGILKLDSWMLMQAGVNWQIVRKEDILAEDILRKMILGKRYNRDLSGTQAPLSA